MTAERLFAFPASTASEVRLGSAVYSSSNGGAEGTTPPGAAGSTAILTISRGWCCCCCRCCCCCICFFIKSLFVVVPSLLIVIACFHHRCLPSESLPVSSYHWCCRVLLACLPRDCQPPRPPRPHEFELCEGFVSSRSRLRSTLAAWASC